MIQIINPTPFKIFFLLPKLIFNIFKIISFLAGKTSQHVIEIQNNWLNRTRLKITQKWIQSLSKRLSRPSNLQTRNAEENKQNYLNPFSKIIAQLTITKFKKEMFFLNFVIRVHNIKWNAVH